MIEVLNDILNFGGIVCKTISYGLKYKCFSYTTWKFLKNLHWGDISFPEGKLQNSFLKTCSLRRRRSTMTTWFISPRLSTQCIHSIHSTCSL